MDKNEYHFSCTSCGHNFSTELTREEFMDFEACVECGENSIVRDNKVDNDLEYGKMGGDNAAPGIADPVRLGNIKPSGEFRDLVKEIHKRTPGSTLNNTRYFD